ncbi:MAG: DUF389 domain-containing protein [Acidimicrobiales bacterium]
MPSCASSSCRHHSLARSCLDPAHLPQELLARPDVSSALPGVGIAIALVPPLGAVGICYQIGRDDLGEGALPLFLTNFACIVFAAALVIIDSATVAAAAG